jgi:demethylmenaquinone methyltransferase/2-methoxy-6-polyprenyl-1,4-benzoquinol methylase
MKLFRPAPSPHQTALAMIGARPGSTVIIVGASEPHLSAEVALVTGLNGRTIVAVPAAGSKPPIESAAANAGALVEIETAPATALPAPDGTADIVVITGLGEAHDSVDRAVREAARVLRPGGRVIVIEGRKAAGFRRLWTASTSDSAGDEILAALAAAGLRATRLLGDSEGVKYFEGTKNL